MPETRVKPSPGIYIAGIAAFGLLLAMAVLLTLLLVVLRDSQRHIRDTDARIARIERGARPVLDGADPALRQAQPLLRSARPLLRGARGLVGPIGDAVERVSIAADVLPAVAADVASIADVARSERLRTGLDALQSLPHLEELTVDLDQNSRRGLELQLASLKTQQRTVRLQFRLLAVADETLQHARSIDTKLGGQLPTARR